MLDKTSSSKVESRSSGHQSDLNDSVKSPESCSGPQSGSSAESGPAAMLPSDGVERAREILAHSSDIYSSTPVKEQSPKTGLRNQDGTKTAGDIGLNGTSAKLGKSSSEKKKRGLSWYSVSNIGIFVKFLSSVVLVFFYELFFYLIIYFKYIFVKFFFS